MNIYSGDNIISKPSLIEPGMKYFLSDTLNRCQQYKKQYYSNWINILGCVILFGGLAMFIYIKISGKLTRDDLDRRDQEKKQYILSRIKLFNDTKKQAEHQTSMTGLPLWQSEFDI